MSQEFSFSVSSEQLDHHRKRHKKTEETIQAVADTAGNIEYVNSLSNEYASDIKSDVNYARHIGLEPKSIHLARPKRLHEDEGAAELNTSYKNSQLAYDPTLDSRESYWSPENLVFHPPILEDEDDFDKVAAQVLKNMDTVYQVNKKNVMTSGNLLIENLPPVDHTRYLIQHPEDVERIEEIADVLNIEDSLQYVLDTGHAADALEMAEAMPSERTNEIHLHDKDKRNGKWDNHIPPSDGMIDMEGFFDYYNEELDHADIVVELKPSEMSPENIRKSYDFVKDHLD